MQGRSRSSAGPGDPWGDEWLACRHCGEPFRPSPRGRKAFCSDECRVRWHSTHRAAHLTERIRGRGTSATSPETVTRGDDPHTLDEDQPGARVRMAQLLQHVRDLEAALAHQRAVTEHERRRADAERDRCGLRGASPVGGAGRRRTEAGLRHDGVPRCTRLAGVAALVMNSAALGKLDHKIMLTNAAAPSPMATLTGQFYGAT